MKQIPSFEVIECGVDWITATAKHKQSTRRLWNEGYRQIQNETRQGNEKRLWSFNGYQGFKSGGVQLGRREDGVCVRLSGGFANEKWRRIFEQSDNVSRLDLQVTVRTGKEPLHEVSRVYREASKYSRSLKRGPTVSTFRSSRGSSTVYLGSRQSDNFGRMYDKERESGLDYYQSCVRFEREVKNDLALHLCAALAVASCTNDFILAQVGQWFLNRGVSRRWSGRSPLFIKSPPRATDSSRQLRWIRQAVAPTVARLISRGLQSEVLDALNLRRTASGHAAVLRLKKTA